MDFFSVEEPSPRDNSLISYEVNESKTHEKILHKIKSKNTVVEFQNIDSYFELGVR